MFPDLFRDEVFTLETRRLFLRWHRSGDAPAIIRLASDRSVTEMTARMPHPYPPDLAASFIAAAREANGAGEQLQLVIADRAEPSTLLGAIGIVKAAEGEAYTLGYWLGRPYWGQGFATEAAHAIIDATFLYTPISEIEASVRVINPASRQVLANCGFQFDGSAMKPRPAWNDSVAVDLYRLTRPLWCSLKGWRAPVPGRLSAEPARA